MQLARECPVVEMHNQTAVPDWVLARIFATRKPDDTLSIEV